jgi:hypothetical protein
MIVQITMSQNNFAIKATGRAQTECVRVVSMVRIIPVGSRSWPSYPHTSVQFRGLHGSFSSASSPCLFILLCHSRNWKQNQIHLQTEAS